MPSDSDGLPPPSPDEIRSPAFQRALDAVPTALLVVDPSGNIAFVNSASQAMFLFERDQLQGQPIHLLVPAAHRSEHSARVSSFFKDPNSRSLGLGMDLSALRSDGTEFPVEIGLTPLPTTEGTWVLASIVDISEWKCLATTAQNQNERLQAYLEATSEGLLSVDESGNIEMVNKAAERIFGYHRSELLGLPIEIIVPEALAKSHAEKRSRYFAEPRLRPMASGLELVGRRKDGTQFPVEVGLNAAQIDGHTIAIAFIADISEKKRLQEQSSVLGALVDFQQRLATSQNIDPESTDADSLTGLDTRASFESAIGKASAQPEGLYVVTYSIQRMDQMILRFGSKTADRIIVFASQYIANTLQGRSDRLFRWQAATFVSIIQRDANLRTVQSQVNEACGKRLEFFGERAHGNSLVMIAISTKVLPLAQTTPAQVIAEIERSAHPGHGS